MLCAPERGPAEDRLVRDLFGLHRVRWSQPSGIAFVLPHGERIRLLRTCGLVVEDPIEVPAPTNVTSDFADNIPLAWARRWPSEEVWITGRC